MSAVNATVDTQGSIAWVLKPQQGFENHYQGIPSYIPILLSPVGMSAPDQALWLERDVVSAGYDPDLGRFTPVPIGARLVLWFPKMRDNSTVTRYRYLLRWRLRNQLVLVDDNTAPFHMRVGLGASDRGAERYVIPAATGEVFTPADHVDAPVNTWRALDESSLLDPNTPQRFLSDQQGIFDSQYFSMPDAPKAAGFYPPVITTAMGDELGLFVTPIPGEVVRDWDFTLDDAGLSNVLGTGYSNTTNCPSHPYEPNVGVYMVVLS